MKFLEGKGSFYSDLGDEWKTCPSVELKIGFAITDINAELGLVVAAARGWVLCGGRMT